jgi:DNA-binding MarR family transcriptional regulator
LEAVVLHRKQARELSRPSDPETSKQAARHVVDSDELGSAQLYALKIVYRNPLSTASELTKASGDVDSRRIGRRLNELEKAGWVIRHPARKCRVTGRNAATWAYNEVL